MQCKIHVNDMKSTDYLFNGYWQIIKRKEGLTSKNVIMLKKGEMHKRASNVFESDEGEEDVDGFEDERLKNICLYLLKNFKVTIFSYYLQKSIIIKMRF